MRFNDCYSLMEEKDKSDDYIEYVSIRCEEPLADLCLEEAETIINSVSFSKKNNNLVKVVLWCHCLGYSDREIADGLNKIRIESIKTETVKKIRQRGLKLIEETYKNIGLITVMHEAFR